MTFRRQDRTGSLRSRRGMRSWPCTDRRAAPSSRYATAATQCWTRCTDVIDIVTDDMPFLVDSLTMELAKHGLAARLVVHPQLRVRRDVTGTLREIAGAASAGQLKDDGASHDELAESWTHIEIPPLADGEAEGLAADLTRVLGDVRVAVEDYARMRARALSLADALTAEGDEARGGAPGDGLRRG